MSQDFSVSTTVKLIRAQHELQQRTASHLNVKVEDLNDISENVLEEAVSSVVSAACAEDAYLAAAAAAYRFDICAASGETPDEYSLSYP